MKGWKTTVLQTDNYDNQLAAPHSLPEKLIVNASHIYDWQQSLVSMLHVSILWPVHQQPKMGMPCRNGTIFLYRSVLGNNLINSWQSDKIYLTAFTPRDPIRSGLPNINIHQEADDVVKLLKSNPYNEFYDSKPTSVTKPFWSNEDYLPLWHSKAYSDLNPLGYQPDPLAPRGCSTAYYKEPPSILSKYRSNLHGAVTTISRTCDTWYSMAANCNPAIESIRPSIGSNDLQQACCSCHIELMEGHFSAPFEMVQHPAETNRILSILTTNAFRDITA